MRCPTACFLDEGLKTICIFSRKFWAQKSFWALAYPPSIRDENDQKSSKLILQIQKGSEQYSCIVTTLLWNQLNMAKFCILLKPKKVKKNDMTSNHHSQDELANNHYVASIAAVTLSIRLWFQQLHCRHRRSSIVVLAAPCSIKGLLWGVG